MAQMKAMLLETQKLQLEDRGKHRIMVSVYAKGNKIWFTAHSSFNDKIDSFDCYEWRSYEENKRNYDNFANHIVADTNKTSADAF